MIRNIIFDWSGTLVDDLPAVFQATNYVFSQAGVQEITLETFRREFTLPFKGFYDRYVPHIPIPQLEQWFHARFKTAQEAVCELPWAREFLEFCHDNEKRLFVLSTVHRDHFAVQTQGNDFGKFFEKTYLEIWDKRRKIRELLTENSLNPKETLFIGDMQHDVETAKVGGVYSCAVLTGYNDAEQLKQSQPDLLVENLGELKQLLHRTQFNLETLSTLPKVPVPTVGAMIFNSQQQALMIRTRKWSDLWGIPGGKIRFGETSEDALRREILEETGLEITGIRFVLVQDCISSPEFYRNAHFILLNYCCQCLNGSEVKLNHEAQEYRWCSASDLGALNLNRPTAVLLEEIRRQHLISWI